MPSNLEPNELDKLLKTLPLSQAPDSMWHNIRGNLRGDSRKPRTSIFWLPVRSPALAACAVVVAVLVGSYVGMLRSFRSPTRWEVIPTTGAPLVDAHRLDGPGSLTKGQWLVTDATSRAQLSIGRIGTAEIGPNTQVRLDPSARREHRLTLERGSLEAIIVAPPRLFFVQTPAALATDLGCAYTLTVDSLGTTHIHVTAGWVELGKDRRVALVPAGFMAIVENGGEPGTPYPVGMSIDAQAALRRLDRGLGDSSDVFRVIDAIRPQSSTITARKENAITLWHLMQHVGGGLRELVLDSLTALSPPPVAVEREGMLALERPMLERWRRDLRPMWSEEAQPFWVRVARRLWEWTMG